MTVPKTLSPELLDILLSGYQKPEDLLGENGLLKPLTSALVEHALEAEMTAHLGHARHESVTHTRGTRNGKSRKTRKGDVGELLIQILRDRSWRLRITAHRQTPSALDELRRQVHFTLGPWTDSTGNSESFGRIVWRRGVSCVDFLGDRCRHRRSQSLAIPSARPHLYDRLSELYPHQNPRYRRRAGENRLSGDRDQPKWGEGSAGTVDRPNRRRQVLVTSRHRTCVDGLKGFPEAIETV
jgi:hypothetical protein